MKFFRKSVGEEYLVVKYYLSSKTTLRDAAWALAIGQSVGNPNVRNDWETDELFEKVMNLMNFCIFGDLSAIDE